MPAACVAAGRAGQATAFSAAFVMALVGGSALSYLTGVLGDRLGLRASLVIVPVALLAQACLFVLLRRRLGRPAAADAVLVD